MRGCAGTRFRLGEMFLRMRSTKRRYERRRNRYQQMCLEFAANVREQNRYMLAAVEAKLSNESITTCHRQYLDLLTRCSQLLHENMNLRLLAMNKLDEEERPPHKVRAEVVEISEPVRLDGNLLVISLLHEFTFCFEGPHFHRIR